MDDDYEIVMSPLCREVTRDGSTVEILIYRGEHDDEWILEVVDEYGGSTVWDDPFPMEKFALDEAMRVIEEEGITAFMRPPKNKLN